MPSVSWFSLVRLAISHPRASETSGKVQGKEALVEEVYIREHLSRPCRIAWV